MNAVATTRFSAALAFTFLLLAGGVAGAAPDIVEDAIRRGIELRRQGEDEQALREFSKAYEASRMPRALAQMGLAEQALGRWLDAEAHIQSALQAPADPWIQKNRTALQSSLDIIAKHLGSLEILGEPRGAEVLVQGKTVGQLPLDKSVRVPNGEIVVELRHPGYRMTSRTVTIIAGEMSRETIVLVPMATETASGTAAPSSGTRGAPLPRSIAQPERIEVVGGPAPAGATGWQRPVKWTAAGLALAAIGLGIVETVVAVGKSNDFNLLPEMCTDDGNGHIAGGQRCEQVNHDQSVATWTAAISYGLGAVFAATAIVLHVAEPRSMGGKQSATLGCGASGTLTGIACVVHW